MTIQPDEDDDLFSSAETKILAALRRGDRLTADQIAERFCVSRTSVKVLISRIRRRLGPQEHIPHGKTGRGAVPEYAIVRTEPGRAA